MEQLFVSVVLTVMFFIGLHAQHLILERKHEYLLARAYQGLGAYQGDPYRPATGRYTANQPDRSAARLARLQHEQERHAAYLNWLNLEPA